MNKRCTWNRILPVAGACVGVACTQLLLGGGAGTGRQFVWMPLLALAWAANDAFLKRNDRREKVLFGILGSFFAASCALNGRLEALDWTGWDGLLLCVAVGICFGPCLGEGFIRLSHGLKKLKKPVSLTPCKAFWSSLIILLLCWLPVLLAFYPGITGYDIDGQAYQVYTGNYSTHHPLLHTLFLELFMELGKWLTDSYSIGYGWHTIAQYVLMGVSVAYAMRWLCIIRCSSVIWTAALIFFALSPQHMIMVSTGTKDVLFAAVMLLLTVELIRFLTEKDREQKASAWIVNIFLTAAACMLRNNTVYGLALLLCLCVVFWRKKTGVRVLAVLLAGVVVGTAGASGLKAATNAGEGSVREMLCVPCQQLARVHYLYGLDHPVGYEVREVLPYADDYAPERADAVKRAAVVDTPERLWRFIKLWIREAWHYPIEYIDAFLLNSKAYWAIDDVSFATTYGSGCMILWHNPATKIEMQNLWPEVKAICEELFTANSYQKLPVLWSLLHPAFFTWLLCFIMVCAMCWRRKEILLPAGVMASYLLTLFLGPCALIRYSYYLMLVLPVLLGVLTVRKETTTNE